MKITSSHCIASFLAVLSIVTAPQVEGADRTWNGGGNDNFWSTPANWGGTAPGSGDSLFFGGSVRLNPANNFPAGTLFNGLTFNNPSASFTLGGNGITLGAAITDNMPLVPQTINLPLALNATRVVSVAADGSLTLVGVISGSAGAGLTKTGSGLLTLSAANTFNGVVTINNGILSIASDGNLGAAPAAPTPGRIVINGGALRSTANFTVNANRGIALGDSGSSGVGTLAVGSGATVIYNGIIANNGGTGGLNKGGFGALTLAGANSYSGPTIIKNGTLTLDFAPAGAPVNNMISSAALTVGGENAGLGAVTFGTLVMNAKAATVNGQTFAGTTIDIGPAVLRANGNGGTANLTLGALAHNPGGALNVVPPGANAGLGAITTTTPNLNGILGAWATYGNGSAPVGNVTIGTDWASVDGSGRIGAYAGYTDYTSGNLHGAVSAGTNLRITAASHPGGAALAYRVNDENAGTVTDINTVAIQNAVQGDTLVVGTGNTLRLGRFGGIFRQDSTTANTVLYFGGVGGTQSGNGTAGSQGIGTITAGGADNTPGEIVFTVNAPSQTQGSFIVEPTITDNGSGAVTVVKVGPGSMKLDGNNTYSGGTYLLQGRVQLAGSEVGTGNPGGFGSGPVLVLPGAYAFLSGIGDFAVTGVGVSNDFSIAGLGLQNEQVGAIRFGNGARLFGDVTLIGDARIGGGNAATLPNTGISGKISGPFNLDLGALQTINTFLSLFNPANDWSGQTTMNARNTATANSIRNGASEVIPHGIGKGNVTLNGNTSTGTITWDLNGFNETINGLISAGNLAGCIIINNAASTTSTLTVGDYDQTASYGGIIQSGAGTVALRKIGGGRQTLTGVNSYTGNTEVNGGTLALSGLGSIASTPLISVNGGAFDVSEVSGGFTHTSPIEITSGTFVIRTTTSPGINSLTLTDSRLRVANLGVAPVIVETATLTTGGASNVIDIASVGTISSYPAQFTIIKYTGTIGGAGFNFGLGDVPTPSTAGYISNNVDNSSVDLVLLDGPKPLTWSGLLGPAWDINTTVNWLAFGVTPSVYLDVDSVRFDDTGASGTVNLTTNLLPGAVVVDNTAREYTFTGPGKISGPAGLTKAGTGSLILSQTGTNDYFGPVAINGGTVQVGNNNAAGNLGGGSVANAGALTFARSDTHTVPNAISGAGSLTQNGSGTLVLSGNSTYTGPTTISQGTLKPGSGSALGAVDGGTVVSSGTTLDVNGQNLGAEPVTVSGGGIGGNGAIINTGGGQNNALQVVTLAGDTVFGGTDRWDIRAVGGVGSLNSGGFGYSITKVGSNQVSLVGLGTVDPMLGNIEVQQGIFSLETSTVQLGDQFSIITVHGGAVLNLFNLNPSGLNKLILLKDGSLLRNENGMSAVHSVVTMETGNITIHGTGTGTTPMFTFNNVISGPGNLFKIGTGPVTLAAQQNDYSGTTTVSNGQVYVDGSVVGGGAWTVYATLGGIGTISSSVTIAPGGTLAPGNPGNPIETLEITGALTMNGTNVMDLNTANFTAPNDVVNFATTINFGGVLRLNNIGPALVSGDSFVLYSFGAATGAFSSIIPSTPGTGLRWDTNSLYVDGVLRVAAVAQPNISDVTQSGGNIVLSGAGGSAGANYFVLSSTNIALPVASWTRILTNSFDGSGNFNLSIPIDPGTPHRFFLLQPE